jgi:hypothetical protein
LNCFSKWAIVVGIDFQKENSGIVTVGLNMVDQGIFQVVDRLFNLMGNWTVGLICDIGLKILSGGQNFRMELLCLR